MIQPRVIEGGDIAANALLYKPLAPAVLNYINEHMNSALSTLSNAQSSFINTIKDTYNKFNNSSIINAAKNAIYNAGYHLDEYAVYMVPYDNFQNINLAMQNYILSEPSLNELCKKNLCYGFQDTYLDPEPDTYKEERLTYQRVMDGVLQFDKEGEGYFKYYSNTDDIELSTIDQISILDTWFNALRHLSEGKDPTDPDLSAL